MKIDMDSTQIYAPFTDEQVKGLNTYQNSGSFHEFTCGGFEHPNDKDKLLIATTHGWHCPYCNYKQNWAWATMANGGMVNAMAAWKEKHGIL